MRNCWDPTPLKRPTFENIVSDLQKVLVDSAISTEEGRVFWKTYFLNEYKVSWKTFVNHLTSFANLPDDDFRNINIRCFHAVLLDQVSDKLDANELEGTVDIQKFGDLLPFFGTITSPQTGGESQPNDEESDSDDGNTIFDRVRRLISHTWFHGFLEAPEAQTKLTGVK